MKQLEGKSAIVTGAAQGIGAVYAQALAAEGARVCLSDIQDTAEAVQAITDSGGDAIGMIIDVTDMAACGAIVAETVSAFGSADILVTNAALFCRVGTAQFLRDRWRRMGQGDGHQHPGRFQLSRPPRP